MPESATFKTKQDTIVPIPPYKEMLPTQPAEPLKTKRIYHSRAQAQLAKINPSRYSHANQHRIENNVKTTHRLIIAL